MCVCVCVCVCVCFRFRVLLFLDWLLNQGKKIQSIPNYLLITELKTFGFMPFEVMYKQPHSGIELGSPIPFATMIMISLWAPPFIKNILRIIMCQFFHSFYIKWKNTYFISKQIFFINLLMSMVFGLKPSPEEI